MVTTRRLRAVIDDVITLLLHVHRKNKLKMGVFLTHSLDHLPAAFISLRASETAAVSENKDTLKWC